MYSVFVMYMDMHVCIHIHSLPVIYMYILTCTSCPFCLPPPSLHSLSLSVTQCPVSPRHMTAFSCTPAGPGELPGHIWPSLAAKEAKTTIR